jgi:hypothetical protein
MKTKEQATSIGEIELKETSKKLKWHRKIIDNKENINIQVIPPSRDLEENAKTTHRCWSTDK